jgi:spermidine synthase
VVNKVLVVLKDVLFVDSGDPWDPNPENVSKVMKMLEGIHKILKPDGVYISISFGQVKLTSSSFFFSFFL